MQNDDQLPQGDAEWNALSIRLLCYADIQMQTKPLTQACSPEDAVQQAINQYFKGKRLWSAGKCSFEKFMRGIIRSIMGSKGLTGMKADEHIDVTFDQDTLCELPDNQISDVSGMDRKRAFEILLECIGDDKELQDLVAALQMGCEKTSEIAEIMQIQTQRVSELKRKLGRYVTKASSLFEMEKGGNPS